MTLVSSFLELVQQLAFVMTAPTFGTFVTIMTGWVFARRHTVTGNDDTTTLDEINIPTASGQVASTDSPQIPAVRDAGGSVGDTIEFRVHFGEFVRLEIDGHWTRVSDFLDWRHHGKLMKADEAVDNMDHNGDGDTVDQLWINNGSVSDITNGGF